MPGGSVPRPSIDGLVPRVLLVACASLHISAFPGSLRVYTPRGYLQTNDTRRVKEFGIQPRNAIAGWSGLASESTSAKSRGPESNRCLRISQRK